MEIFVPKAGAASRAGADGSRERHRDPAGPARPVAGGYHKQEQALTELQQALHLPEPPNRIECYDISNTQGTAIVGAMVVFTQGVPDKKLYRKFNIESVVGAPDDFASMEEMLTRADFDGGSAGQEIGIEPGSKPDASFSFLPDLVIIDGGKGQLAGPSMSLRGLSYAIKFPWWDWQNNSEEMFFPHQIRFADAAPAFTGIIFGAANP